jgi:serine/threonine protein kinase
LGQGAFGRVFLAEQISLSNRLVVVKITSARTIEHQTLARLRHPNIVPVFSVHRDEQTRLQAVCMPHQGAVSLASVLSTWSAGQGTPSGADAFLDALEKLSPPDSRKLDAESDASTFPRRRTFVYACVWLFHRLALGLAHAHARGILHRDLKPSNVLLTPSGQPLLADFNLAFNQVDSPDNAAAFFGGTLGYMPPEQLEALHPAEQGSPDEVDSRSDVFGLAATLFELLTGQLPFGMPSQDQDQWSALREQIERRYTLAPSARGLNRHVSWDLSALLSKCLDPNPDRRYESATDLADDLARYLENRSLGRIGKIPRRDRTWKYVVRNWPRLIAAAGSLTVAAAIAGTVYDAQVTRNKLLRADLERVNLERDKALAEKEAEKARTDLVLAKATARDQVETELKELMPKIRHLSPQEQAAQVFRVGWFAQNQSRFHHAIMFYDRAIEMGYEDAQVFYFRGASHAFLDEDREAVRDFTEAIARRPDFARYYVSRAVTFASAPDPTVKDYDKALLDAEKALEKCPENDPETTKEVFFRVAGVLSAASKGPCSVSSETLLERAEEYLLRAMDLGYSPQGVLREHRLSRFKMLETVLARPRVRERMEDEP